MHLLCSRTSRICACTCKAAIVVETQRQVLEKEGGRIIVLGSSSLCGGDKGWTIGEVERELSESDIYND